MVVTNLILKNCKGGLLSVFFLFLLNCFSQSIVNTEKLFNEGDKSFAISAELSGDFISGNNDLLMIEHSLNFAYTKNKNTIMLLGSGEHLREDADEDVLNQITGQIRYIYSLTDKFKLFGFLQGQTVGNLLLNERLLAGGGVRASVFNIDFGNTNNSAFRFHLSCGVMREKEVLDNSTLPIFEIFETNYTRAIFSSISVLKLSNSINLINTTYFQQYVKDIHDYRVFNEANLIFSIHDWLSLSLDFEYRFDSDPPSVLKKQDYRTQIGFVFNM